MKTARLLLATVLGWSLLPTLAIASPQAAPPGPALPPPALHDPGVRASAPAAGSVGSPMAPPAVALPSMHDDGTARDETPPQVTIRQRGDDSVQEYWRAGQLYMVVVTPKNGVPYSYMLDPQGRWVDEHGQKPMRPVMYKILEWGKSRPATARSSGG
ncbi:MAG: DUF2782 domain-containing protein [Xanthomonadales bacterium]|nr:DUF2782 domain-containing protein [Xanthomonadales bacterium]